MDASLLLEQLPVAVFAVDPDGQTTPANAEARRRHALLDAEAHPASAQVAATLIAAALAGADPKGVEIEVDHALLTLTARSVRAPDGALSGAVLTVAQAENGGGRAEARPSGVTLQLVEAVLEHSADPLFVKDREFRFVLVNRSLCEMVGRSREELIGGTDYDFCSREQADFFRMKDEEMFRGEARIVIDEEPFTAPDGQTTLLATTRVPLRDADGRVTHLVGTTHDITALKSAQTALAGEVAAKTAALNHLSALHTELSVFTDEISHDLRSPLTSIGAFTEVVLAYHGPGLDPTHRGYLRRVVAATQRMTALLDDLLAFSSASRSSLVPAPLDLSALAEDVVSDLRESAPLRSVAVHVAAPLAAVGDARLLRVLFENLIGNAWKFTGRVGAARIEIGQDPPGSYFVRDNGVGIAPADAARIFEPFQRLHSPQQFTGTGLGLASVRRIVERHGGRVWAEGALGVGTTIWFTLPG